MKKVEQGLTEKQQRELFLKQLSGEITFEKLLSKFSSQTTMNRLRDDLGHILEKEKDASKALKLWAEELQSSVDYIKELSEAIEDKDVQIEADCHFISLSSKDNDLLDTLLEDHLLDGEIT